MKDEIKETIDYLKAHESNLTFRINELLKYFDELQEDNERLKELCNKYEEEHNTTFNYWKQLIKEDYKSRCERAIEYINLTGYGTDFSMNAEEVDVLFNILKGSE